MSSYLGPVGYSGAKLEHAYEFHGDTYHAWTPSVDASELRKATLSVWVRRAVWNANHYLVQAYVSASDEFTLRIDSGNTVTAITQNSGDLMRLVSTDTIADNDWHHIHLLVDFDHGTEAERGKLYIDNVEVTYGTSTRPAQGTDYRALFKANAHTVGRYGVSNNQRLRGLLGDVNLIQGQALPPSEFGKDDGSGNWVWKDYRGTHGTNGYRLQYKTADAELNTAL